MTQYHNVNVKLSNSHLNKLKSQIKNGAEVNLNLSSNVTGDSNDETNFLYRLLFTDRQVSRLCKALANISSANMKVSKTQLSKIAQSGELLGRLLEPLLKTGLPLMKKLLILLTKSALIPSGLTGAASAADARIHKKLAHGCILPTYHCKQYCDLPLQTDLSLQTKKEINNIINVPDIKLSPDNFIFLASISPFENSCESIVRYYK